MSKETSTKTENSPPEWSKPLFTQSASEASRLYNSGAGGNTYLGSTVAAPSSTTMAGINQLADAGSNWDTAGSRPLFQGIGAAAASPSYSENNLASMADGSYLRDGNPYFKDALQGQLDDTAAQVQSQFSGSGRYGSGANTGVLTKNLGNIRSSALSNQYNQDAQNMLTANGMMDQSRLAGLGQAQTAANSIAGLDQQNFQNRLYGAGATMQAGQALDQQSQAQLSDEIAKFYALDNQDWNRLAMLQSAAAGSAGNYGTQNSTQRQPMNIAGPLATLISGGKA